MSKLRITIEADQYIGTSIAVTRPADNFTLAVVSSDKGISYNCAQVLKTMWFYLRETHKEMQKLGLIDASLRFRDIVPDVINDV